MNDALGEAWRDLLGVWAVDRSAGDRALDDVRRHYAGPGRFYHTFDHIRHVL